MAKRRADWGSVQKVGTNTYRLRYWASDESGYKRRSKTLRNVTRREAGDELARLRLEHSADAPCPTVRQVYEQWWLPERERMVKGGEFRDSTLSVLKSVWNANVLPRWADVPLDQIRPLDMQQWLSTVNFNQAKKSVSLLRQACDYGVMYEFLEGNPMNVRYQYPSKSTVTETSKRVYTYEEMGRVLKAVRGDWIEPCVIFQALGGCRVGESLWPRSVELREVDGVPVAVTLIDGQVTKDGIESDQLKNQWSHRPVVVPGKAALVLKEISDSAAGWYMTDNGDGKGVKRPRLMRRWYEKLDEAGIERAPMHNLRPSWQTNCRWTLKMPPWLIEPMMGHVVNDTTGHHYDRPTADVFAEAMASAYKERPFDTDWEI